MMNISSTDGLVLYTINTLHEHPDHTVRKKKVKTQG
jgi:hypothetical protein